MDHDLLELLEQPVPLRQRIYETLEELIIFGALRPGQHLVESRLAHRLGVSRVPIREALQLLYSDGWVDLRPHQGAFVHEPTVQEVDEVFTVRTLLEVESARLAAMNVTKESLQSISELIELGTTALENADEKGLIGLNSAFHARVSEIAGNQVLAELIARLDKWIRWYFAPVVSERGRDSWREHTELVEAVAARDSDRAAEVMRAHTEMTRSAYHLWRQG